MNQPASAPTFTPASSLADRYEEILLEYLSSQEESTLQRAYEFGRAALAGGASVLDIVLAHHAAWERAHKRKHDFPARSRAYVRPAEAGRFLVECLAPFEMALRGAKEGNNALLRVNEALEQEAHRIARILHDEVGQILFAVQIAIAELSRHAGAALAPLISSVTSLVCEAQQQVRSLSHELRPAVLDDLGLVAALENIARGIANRTCIEVRVTSSIEERLPRKIETLLYRVVHEALANVARHSRAERAEVSLRRLSQCIECSVGDDGVGFDVDYPERREGVAGLGLVGIRERLNAAGGTLDIESKRFQGTTLRIRIPMGGEP